MITTNTPRTVAQHPEDCRAKARITGSEEQRHALSRWSAASAQVIYTELSPDSSKGFVDRSCALVCDDNFCGDLKLEGRTFGRSSRRPYPPIVVLDNRMTYGKTHAHALRLCGDQGLEEAVSGERIESLSRILDSNVGHVRSSKAGPYAKHAALRGVHRLNGILDQI